MTLDPEVLLNYPVPEVRQRYSRCDSAFYALTSGLDGDPLDERQLVYVDPCRDLQVLPCITLILGHLGFWLGNLAISVDALRLVHDEQHLGWQRLLPAEGEAIGRTRVTDLAGKDTGKSALFYSEKVLSDTLSGEVLAVTRSTTFLCGDDGFGGSRQVPEIPHRLPGRASDLRLDLSTRSEQALYYHLNGDDNPSHTEPAAALRASFPRSILHGLCTLGMTFHAVLCGLADYHTEQLGHLQVRFSAPVSPGEASRTGMRSDDSFHTRIVERDMVVPGDGRVGPSPGRSD